MRHRTVLHLALAVFLMLLGVIGIWYWALLTHSYEATIHRDLELSNRHTVQVLEFETIVDPDHDTSREEALVVISDGTEYRLVHLDREPFAPLPHRTEWRISVVSIMYVDGHDEWMFFERSFDHFPTDAEIAEFKVWVSQW